MLHPSFQNQPHLLWCEGKAAADLRGEMAIFPAEQGELSQEDISPIFADL